MAEENKVSAEKMMEIMRDYYPLLNTVDFHGQEITVASCIPYEVMSMIVQRVSEQCFDEDGNYMPEMKEFAIRLCVTMAYTNIELPNDLEEQYAVLFNTNLWSTIISAISGGQYDDMVRSIDERIAVQVDTNKKMFERELQQAMDAIGGLTGQIAQMFDGITAGDIRTMIKAIGENGIDEGKIAQAVVAEQNKMRGDAVIPSRASDEDDGK